MQQLEFYRIFVEKLESSNIPYMVTGSVASIFYGEPRLTHDIDFVLFLHRSSIKLFCALFPDSEYYCPPDEVLRIELARQTHAHFNLIHHQSGLKADCYPFTGDPLHQWALENSRKITFNENRGIRLAPPEYVIIRKLEYYAAGGSEKHLRDIRSIRALQEESLNNGFLESELVKRRLVDAYTKTSP